MEFWKVVESRHSYRSFSTDEVPREKIECVLRAASAAPSAMNAQPWRFHVMQAESRQKAGELIAQATLHLAEYVDQMHDWDREEALEWYSFLGHAPVLIGVSMPSGGTDLDQTNNLLSLGASIENLLLAATAEELGACNVTFPQWVQDELTGLVGLNGERTIVAAVALGYPGPMQPLAPAHDQDVADWLE